MADDEIQLASDTEVMALNVQWTNPVGKRCTTPQVYVEHISKAKQRHYKRAGPGPYAEQVKIDRAARSERMHAEYKRTEEERIAKRAQEAADKALEAAYPKVKGRGLRKQRPLTEEEKRWNKIFEEKHEDKNYYGIRANIGSSCAGLNELAPDGADNPATVRR